MSSGILSAWALVGDGRYSVTDTSSAVDSGSHAANNAVRTARGSRERRTWGGRLRLRDFVIFSTMAGSLNCSK